MAITAAMVKELRQRSGAGMMDCKKALKETDGNIDEALTFLQKKGMASAKKKAGRTAAQGLIGYKLADDATSGIILEVNCETDFVARNDQFKNFVAELSNFAFNSSANNAEELSVLPYNDEKTVGAWVQEQIANIGENIQFRRMVRVANPEGVIGAYVHAGSQIGVLVPVNVNGADADVAKEFARDIAMHVAASNPLYTTPEEISAEETAKQKDIFMGQAAEMNKPANIVEKIIGGRLRKWQAEISLVKQPFVKDPDFTVEKYQKKIGGVAIAGFTRFQVGEGIEVKETNLADEVAALQK